MSKRGMLATAMLMATMKHGHRGFGISYANGSNCAGCNKPRLTPGERKRGVTLCPSCNRKVKVAEDE